MKFKSAQKEKQSNTVNGLNTMIDQLQLKNVKTFNQPQKLRYGLIATIKHLNELSGKMRTVLGLLEKTNVDIYIIGIQI